MGSEEKCYSVKLGNDSSGVKPLPDLISEIKLLNFDYPGRKLDGILESFQSAKFLKQNIAEVDLRKWVERLKLKNAQSNVFERIAYVWRAMELASKLEVRDIQVLTVMMMYEHEPGRGHLAQVNTGEGKTIIIAMLAVMLCFDGHKVDVGRFEKNQIKKSP